MPAGRRLVRGEELVEAAVAAVDDQHVRVGAALDLRVLGDRVADVVGLIRVAEPHALSLLRPADDVDRDAVALERAEVGVHAIAVGRSRVVRRVAGDRSASTRLFHTFVLGKIGHPGAVASGDAAAPGARNAHTPAPRPPAASAAAIRMRPRIPGRYRASSRPTTTRKRVSELSVARPARARTASRTPDAEPVGGRRVDAASVMSSAAAPPRDRGGVAEQPRPRRLGMHPPGERLRGACCRHGRGRRRARGELRAGHLELRAERSADSSSRRPSGRSRPRPRRRRPPTEARSARRSGTAPRRGLPVRAARPRSDSRIARAA